MSKRNEKIAEQIKEELGFLIRKNVELPSGSIVSVSKVDIAGNLEYALVWISVLPVEKSNEVLKILLKGKKLLQNEVALKVFLRSTPKIHFKIDEKVQEAFELEKLLDEIASNNNEDSSSDI